MSKNFGMTVTYGIALDFTMSRLLAGVGPPIPMLLAVTAAAVSALLFRTFASNLDAEHILTMYLRATWDSCFWWVNGGNDLSIIHE